MIDIKLIPSIHDKDIHIHKPNLFEKIFYEYGYIDCYINAFSNFKDPLARKNKISKVVYIKRYNETFSCWNWCKVEDRWGKYFKNKSL